MTQPDAPAVSPSRAFNNAVSTLQAHLDDFDRDNADDIDADDFNIGQDDYIEVPAATLRRVLEALASAPVEGGAFVAGGVWKLEGEGEDGEDLWKSEVQTMGGYGVVATCYGATQAEASGRRDAILAALQAQDGEPSSNPCQLPAPKAWVWWGMTGEPIATANKRRADDARRAGWNPEPLYAQPPASTDGWRPDREAAARAIDPDAWTDDLPVPTRADTLVFHQRRQASIAAADRVLALQPEGGR